MSGKYSTDRVIVITHVVVKTVQRRNLKDLDYHDIDGPRGQDPICQSCQRS